MVLLNRYKVYCINEELSYYEWNVDFPLNCPNDGDTISGAGDPKTYIDKTLSFGDPLTLTNNYTITSNTINKVFYCDTSGGSIVITLISASLVDGQSYFFLVTNATNTLTINTVNSETIDAVTTKSFTVLGDNLTITSDGSNWTTNVNVVRPYPSDLFDPVEILLNQVSAYTTNSISSNNHSDLTNLTVGDDHTQYALLSGRAGGQALIGGTNASDNLTLTSTSNATKGYVQINKLLPVLNRKVITNADSPYSILTSNHYIGVDTSSGAITLTMPLSSSCSDGQVIIIKDEGGNAKTNNITINRSGSDTIDGDTQVIIKTNKVSLYFITDGTSKWFII